ncbi:MAG: hypothetical protein B7Z33_13965 [Sphingomonadales bacterium 12-68-11]|nr:MAG: hypothetical protein B7Z33_13965 [Sphingomonadales bacterium 12-68-11]OYX17097.1 MAG: hypothetical protein B7Z07_00930 [Sphingomonadales bacterium 32-67-7]
MQRNIQFWLGAGFAAILAPSLAACGGGGGGSAGGTGVVSTPVAPPAPPPASSAVAPAPASAMTLAPVPAQFDTAEFRKSEGPLQHNAAVAWQAGHTGTGVTIAVIDTGIDSDSPEFAGRLSQASRDLFSAGRTVDGIDDHGTNVAMIAAAARDSKGVLGIAYGATVLALRADEPGSCGGNSLQAGSSACAFPDHILAQGVAYAVQNGAKVINLSMGSADGAGSALRSAVTNAVGAGALVVVAAGNEAQAQLSAFASQLDTAGGGGVLVVGSIDANGAISSFSNRAGSQAQNYLAARGETMCCVYSGGQIYADEQGRNYVISGTSFSAPQVSGAAALLAQAFPHLTGRQIAQILLESAYDAGAAGTDAVYGRGILDIAKAFRPSGATTLAGGSAVAMGDSSGTGSSAMGDSTRTASLKTVVLDAYGRAFATDLAGTLRGAQPAPRLAGAVDAQQRRVAFGNDQAAVAFTVDASGAFGEAPRLAQLRLAHEDAEQARVLAARVTTRISPQWQLGFAYRDGADGLAAQLQGQDRAAFLIAPFSGADDAGSARSDTALAVRRAVAGWGVTLFAERGEWQSGAEMRRAAEQHARRLGGGTASYGVSFDRRFGALAASLGVSRLAEDETLLGGRFHDSFALAGADTTFIDARAAWDMGSGWQFGAALRQGWSTARDGGLVAEGSRLESRAWSLDLTRRGVFGVRDSLGLRVAQPLRVEGGGVNFLLPSGWDYASQTATYQLQGLGLAPKGRELVGELAWQGSVLAGFGSASLFYRRDPGHYAAVPDDFGTALRWSGKF